MGLILCPTLGSRLNAIRFSRTAVKYSYDLSLLSEETLESRLQAAQSYNEAVKDLGSVESLSHPEKIPGYEDALSIDESSIMGSITIEKIGVDLPIYHSTGERVSEKGAEHLKGSSLPTGGVGNHSVIYAHSGLPGARLFTDLEKLQSGDIFVLHILGEDLTYEIESVKTVLPTQVEELYLKEGEDLVTLMTCTPYGINSHRLLVRAHRVLP